MKKYVLVGCGVRGMTSYVIPFVKDLADCVNLCGVCDRNIKRAKLASEFTGTNIPVFTDFDKMVEEVKPDCVVVTTIDADHDYYIIKAMEAGCDVVVEKPLTTDAEKCRRIFDVQKRTGREIVVTFNLRFSPFIKRVKEILSSSEIGEVLSVHFEWLLDTSHGADYFRRWHRERKNSGSLLIHKSTHHFDLVNWLIDQEPEKVSAFGTRRFYGPTRDKRSERCLTCPYKSSCEFYFDIKETDLIKKLYYDCEDEDGYYRDKCVFSGEIDIEDSVCLNVRYNKGAIMSYSLTAHSPYEGLHMMINCSKARIEIDSVAKRTQGFSLANENRVRIYNRMGEEITYKFPEHSSEGHAGADDNMRSKIFRDKGDDPLRQLADTRAGAMSIGIGIASNISLKEGRQVSIKEIYGDIT